MEMQGFCPTAILINKQTMRTISGHTAAYSNGRFWIVVNNSRAAREEDVYYKKSQSSLTCYS